MKMWIGALILVSPSAWTLAAIAPPQFGFVEDVLVSREAFPPGGATALPYLALSGALNAVLAGVNARLLVLASGGLVYPDSYGIVVRIPPAREGFYQLPD
jgi:hypothetical protein